MNSVIQQVHDTEQNRNASSSQANPEQAKVIYILPLYDRDTDTHLRYNYKLIEAAARKIDIFAVIEKANSEVGLPNSVRWYVQKFRNPTLRFLELLFLCFRLRVSGYKHLYSHYSYYGALAGIASGMKTFYWNRGMPWLFKRGWFEEMIFHIVLRHSILVTSPRELAEEYKRRYGVKKYCVLPNWIDLKEFAPQDSKEEAKKQIRLDPSKKIVLFVHHLSERKGADLIAKTAAAFSPSDGVEFVVVGDGPYRKALEEEAKRSPVPITILGRISNERIPDYFRAADIFFMPSREEGSPHVLLEAMAAGTPFVATDVGGVKEIVPESLCGNLCRSEDVPCFQEKIKTPLQNAAFYQKARAEGFRMAKEFGKERGVKEFVALFAD